MYAVRGALVRVFVPEYHVRGVVHLADRDGVALPPPASRVRRSLPPVPLAAPGTVLSPACARNCCSGGLVPWGGVQLDQLPAPHRTSGSDVHGDTCRT